MTKVFAYKCYADKDVFLFLKEERGLPIEGLHGFGAGEVVNEVLIRGRADIGMVDEDPLSSHHAQRDEPQLVSTTENLMVRRRRDRYLLIVKPELEECFLRSVRLVGLESRLPNRPADLRALLGIPNNPKHRAFREELSSLYRESKARRVRTLGQLEPLS